MNDAALQFLAVGRMADNRRARQPTQGTCGWIQQRNQFMAWGRTNKLWISGRFGCGKTYLAEHIHNWVLRSPGARSVCCFLDDLDPRDRDTTSVLRTLLHGILSHRQDLIKDCLGNIYAEHPSDFRWTWDVARSLWERVRNALQDDGGPRITLIVDGVDLCLARLHVQHLQDFLECVGGAGPFRVLILSRPLFGLAGAQVRHGFTLYEMEEADTEADIATTVEARARSIRMATGSGSSEDDERLAEAIRRIAQETGNKTHRWAALQLGALEANPLVDLPPVPPDLVRLYDGLLKRSRTKNKEAETVNLVDVLQWIACQERPMKEEELLEALLQRHQDPAGRVKHETRWNLYLEALQREVATRLGELVDFNDKDKTYAPAHASVKTYLTTPPGELSSNRGREFYYGKSAEMEIFTLCTGYLCRSDFHQSGSAWQERASDEWVRKVEGRIRDHPFLGYAGRFWLRHAYRAGMSIHPRSPDRKRRPSPPAHWALLDPKKDQPQWHAALCWKEVWWLAEHRNPDSGTLANFPKNLTRPNFLDELLQWAGFDLASPPLSEPSPQPCFTCVKLLGGRVFMFSLSVRLPRRDDNQD